MQLLSGQAVSPGDSPCVAYADFVSGDAVTGWAIDPRSAAKPVVLRAVIDDDQVGTVCCVLPREDIRNAGIASNVGGFRFPIPLIFQDGIEHTLRLFLPSGGAVCFPARDGTVRTSHSFCIDAASMAEGCVDTPSAEAIEGWAMRRGSAAGVQLGGCEIAVLEAGIEIARLPANLRRDDVARAKGCDAHVGFRFVPPAHLRTGRELTLDFVILPERIPLQRSPQTASFLPIDAVARLAALGDAMDELFTQAWGIRRAIRELLPRPEHTIDTYHDWAQRYFSALRARVEADRNAGDEAPLVSIICPLFRPQLSEFNAAVRSVLRQTYSHWELILVDDASRSAGLSAVLRGMAAGDPRIRVLRARRNGGIAAATNLGIAEARGRWVAFLDHDDMLEDVALEVMVRAAQRHGGRVLYSDEDKIEADGRLVEPHLKPDWNWRLALSTNFVCHLLMVEAALLRETGVLDTACDGAQDYDLVLRLSERVAASEIRHVPEILYHWRKTVASTAADAGAKPHAVAAGISVISAHLQRRGLAAEVSAPYGGTFYRVKWRFEQKPSVRIIMPFRDQAEITRRCIETLLLRTDYANYRLVLVDNGSTTPEAARLCAEMSRHRRVSVLRDELPFNYSRLNNRAMRGGDADFVLLLNNDVLIEQNDWLRRMVDEALADPGVAVVGCKLIYPDRRIQHAGVVLGVGGVADHAFKGLDASEPGYVARAWCAQEYSAVTAACLLCRADAYREVGGLDEDALAVAFNDVDLCLKLRRAGWRVIWTPDVVAEHHESLSRGDDMTPQNRTRFLVENQTMLDRWKDTLHRDPFYNRHFSRERGPFRVLADESLRFARHGD